jgi:hypothetical protein
MPRLAGASPEILVISPSSRSYRDAIDACILGVILQHLEEL